MNRLKKFLLILNTIISSCAFAQNKDPNIYALMTARDMLRSEISNISIANHTNQSITASGLFIASFDINDCSACYGNIVSGDNTGGAFSSSVTFKPNQAIAIGQNYLYNMIYNGIYYIKNTTGSSPCSLPGCSWPGDANNVQGWCISVNVTSIHSNYTYSNYSNGANPPANFPAYSQAGNSIPYNYKYDLIDPSTLSTGNMCLGPVACNDKTLTCKVASAQSESLQVYS